MFRLEVDVEWELTLVLEGFFILLIYWIVVYFIIIKGVDVIFKIKVVFKKSVFNLIS